MYPVLRLSRIEAPRTTAWSVAVLIFASILFGVWALAVYPIPERLSVSDSGLSPAAGHFVADRSERTATRR